MTYEDKAVKIVKAGLGLAAIGGLTYLGYRVYKIAKQAKIDAELDQKYEEHAEAEKIINQDYDKVAKGFDDEPEDEEEEHVIRTATILRPDFDNISEVGNEAPGPVEPIDEDIIRDSIKAIVDAYKGDSELFPFDLESSDGNSGIRFETREDLRTMRFGVETPEAMKQFKMFTLAEVSEFQDSYLFHTLQDWLNVPVHITRARDENLALNIRQNRKDFFGPDAPDYILDSQTFGELVILLAKKAQYDWGDNELEDLIAEMIFNLDWENLLSHYDASNTTEQPVLKAATAINVIMDNRYTYDDVKHHQTIGLFGLPLEKLDRVNHDSEYGFLDQYNDSTFGE